MKYGLRKSLEDIAWELKGIKNILGTLWQVKYQTDETSLLNPDSFADEYISTEECARRLNVSDQTIRNWMSIGRKNADKGWKEGIHYINVSPDPSKKAVIRVPWNSLVRSFAKDRPAETNDFQKGRPLYVIPERGEVL